MIIRREAAEDIAAIRRVILAAFEGDDEADLVDRLREEVRQQLHQHYPQFSRFSEQEQISHLQQLTALSASELHRALFSDNLQHPHDFTLAVACLQTIRNSI